MKLLLLTTSLFFLPPALLMAEDSDSSATSLNSEVRVLPAPGPVMIDGASGDWDLSAGVWSYNNPVLAPKTSVWTHLMWDARGVYFLARYADRSPLKNATMGKDFHKSWQGDAYQARVILDDGLADEHQMHINLFFSTPEQQPYMIVKHGGFRATAPFDETGPDRPDLEARFGPTMEKAGGKVAFAAWPDGKGYNAEAFWPWSYLRQSGQPLKPGEQFTFGIEAMWGTNDGSNYVTNRLADGIQNDRVNRIFMFRSRKGWGRAVLSERGNLDISRKQEELHARRLKRFVNYETYGSIPLRYSLSEDREVTIAIDDAKGQRVRNLFGQYPRRAGENTDLWDGLDDAGKPVSPGKYHFTVLDHRPVEVKFANSLYNAGTPPWRTDSGEKLWGANHGYPTTIATRGAQTVVGFTGTEGSTGLLAMGKDGRIKWTDATETLDATLDERYAYALSRDGWTARTLLRRFDLSTGRLTPFEDENKSTESILLPHNKVGDNCTLASNGTVLFANIPQHGLFVLNPTSGSIVSQAPPGNLLSVTDREGTVYGLFQDGTVATLNEKGEIATRLFQAAGLSKPSRLAVKQDKSEFAISDAGSNQVLIFSARGKRQKALGSPYQAPDGLRPAGDFIVTNLINPLGLDYDGEGLLWVAEAQRHSKRVTNWSSQGKLVNQYWGGADYGAMAGFPVTLDSRRFVAHGVEFELDPDPQPHLRPTREKPIRFHPALAETRGFIYRVRGREYAVNSPGYNGGGQQPVTVSLRDKNGVFVPRVWFRYPSRTLHHGLWKEVPGSAWVDRNENGREDADEVVHGVQGRPHYWSNGWMRPDLTFITQDSYVYSPRGFTKTGIPLYDFANAVRPPNALPLMDGQGSVGTIVMDAAGNISDGIRFATVDGRQGSYPNLYGRHDAPAAQRGVLIAPFRTNGVVEDLPGLGSVTALGGDRGEWFLMTMDGLYISSILQDAKADTTLDETFTGQESFGGFFWKDERGKIMAQLGGASYRIMEITGLDSARRTRVELTVDAAQIDAGAAIAGARRAAASSEPAELAIPRLAALPATPAAPVLDETVPLIAGARAFKVQEPGNPARWFRTAMAHDGQKLAVMFQVADPTPWQNGEGRFTHAFIGGDAVDLMLEVPGRGPIRLLASNLGGQNTAVYWQKQSALPDNPITYIVANNQTNAQKFDVVKRLPAATIGHQNGEGVYTVLLTVPLAELGLEATAAVKGTVGVIYSDPTGRNRAARLYWYDKATGLVSDVPSESMLMPGRWGKITLEK